MRDFLQDAVGFMLFGGGMGEVWGLLGLASISFARNALIFFFGAKIC